MGIICFLILFLISYYFILEVVTKHLTNNQVLYTNNNNKIYYCCYKKKKNLGMWFRSFFGCHVCSSAIIINNHIYRLKKDVITIVKEKITEDYITSHYYVIDTGYTTDILCCEWEKTLLKLKRLNKDKLFKGFNCLKNCSFILNQLPKFKVKSYERFTSIYVLRLVLTGIWKIKWK